MTRLDLLWWAGLAYFAAWMAMPLAALPLLGPVLGLVVWVLLAPWSALAGMSAAHRLLPRSPSGTFAMFADRGSVRWAVKSWAPSLYLAVFQPVCFLSEGFQRVALRAFGAQLGRGALLTSRTIIREPHRVHLGADSLIGEYALLLCAYQPRSKVLVVADISVGARTMVGGYCHLAPGARVGADSLLEYAVRLGAHSTVGDDTRIGAGTSIYNAVRIGNHVRIGKGCLIPSGSVIPDGARIPDGTVFGPQRDAC